MKIYAVGGSVRDSLMGLESNDNDYVVVGSSPEEMISLGYKQVGADFPVFLHPVTGEEYALARTERKVGSGYNGFVCEFSPNVTIEEDLSRRDLTINAIARDMDTGEIIDPYNGRLDIEKGVLRHVSDAFGEDPLRVVRLARFYARFEGFLVAAETVKLADAIVKRGDLDSITNERYWAEMLKVFSDDNSDPRKFFAALKNFDVFNKVPFFVDIFGKEPNFVMMRSVEWNTFFLYKEPELKMATFIALTENCAIMQKNAIPNRVSTLVKNFRILYKTNFSHSASIYDIIASTRSLNKPSDSFLDLMQAMCLKDSYKYQTILYMSVCLVNRVNADKYMHLSGVEIGIEMKKERLKIISSLIERR